MISDVIVSWLVPQAVDDDEVWLARWMKRNAKPKEEEQPHAGDQEGRSQLDQDRDDPRSNPREGTGGIGAV